MVFPKARSRDGIIVELLPMQPEQFICFLSAVSAAKSEWHPDEVERWLPYPFLKDARKRIFGVRVHGDCMTPTLSDSDLVFVDTQYDRDTLNNRIVVVRLGGEETTLKRFFLRENGIELRPDNGEYPSIFVKPEEEPEIVGVVVKRVGGSVRSVFPGEVLVNTIKARKRISGLLLDYHYSFCE